MDYSERYTSSDDSSEDSDVFMDENVFENLRDATGELEEEWAYVQYAIESAAPSLPTDGQEDVASDPALLPLPREMYIDTVRAAADELKRIHGVSGTARRYIPNESRDLAGRRYKGNRPTGQLVPLIREIRPQCSSESVLRLEIYRQYFHPKYQTYRCMDWNKCSLYEERHRCAWCKSKPLLCANGRINMGIIHRLPR